MKKILSVSLGSTSRDHTTEAEFMGQHFWLSRQGVNGDFKRYIQEFEKHDGKVDAFGVGGTEFYLWVNGRRYYFREGKKVRQAIKISKAGDGNGIKHLLGPLSMQALRDHGIDPAGKKALKTTATDRYGLARALVDAGCDVTFGDLMFALDIPIAIKGLNNVHLLAKTLLPVVTQFPYKWLYPLGDKQDMEPSKKYSKYYEEVEIIAGDFIQVWMHLPDDLTDKIIVTNTTTERNVEELQKRNLKILVTNTPRLNGRSFGTNVIEAMCRTLIDKPDDQITQDDLKDMVDKVPLRPEVHVLN
jgi:hypothetical protein